MFKNYTLALSLIASISLSAVVHHVDTIAPYLSSKKVVIVKIYAPFLCKPCNSLAPEFQKASNNFAQHNDIAFLEINGNKAKSLGVKNYPTVIIYKDGREVMRHVGSCSVSYITQAVTKALQ